jgi:hypothetical protein
MTVPELEDYIKRYKDLIKQAETALDFRRVVLSSSQLELDQRKAAERRRLQSDKTKYPVRTITMDKKTGKPKVANANTAQLMQMMQALAALKTLKDNQAKAKQMADAGKAVDKKMGEPKP